MRKFIAKVLGLPTLEEVQKFNEQSMTIALKSDEALESNRKALQSMNDLRNDMKTLYGELNQDIANVKSNVKQIKPILKVQDEEAVAFIKGILKKHDVNMSNNQTDLHQRTIQLGQLQTKIETATRKAEEASRRLNNVLNGLGMMPEYDNDTLMTTFRGLISERATHDAEHVSK